MSLLTVSADDSTAEGCKDSGKLFYASLGNGDYVCTNDTSDILAEIDEGKSANVKVLHDYTPGANVTLNKNITYDLNGNTLTFDTTHKYTIEGAEVTFKNGTIVVPTSAPAGVFTVNSATKASKLTIDATVESDTTNAIVQISSAVKNTEVNLNGSWEVKGELVGCTTGDKETINLNAKITANLTGTQLVSINAGASVVNVLGGSYESNRLVFRLTNGTLNVKAGTIKSTGDNAILVNTADSDKKHALNINGGTITTEAENKYSVYFEYGTNAKNGTYSITDGTFTSGEDEKGNQLPALYINAQEFLDNHKAWIKGGKFTKAVVGDVKVGTKVYKTSAAATAILVGNATVLNG